MPQAGARITAKKANRTVRERRVTYQVASSPSEFHPVTRGQINAVVRKIVDEFNPEKIILFGSYAYGKPNIDSDVDMLVVMKSRERPTVRTARVIGSLLDIKTFPMDLIVRTPAELQQRLAIGDFFIEEIVSLGKVLYERHTA